MTPLAIAASAPPFGLGPYVAPATPHPGAVAEDGAPSSPGSSSPRSSVASSARDDAASEAAEDAASVALLRAVHAAFPAAAVERYSAAWLRADRDGRPLIRRSFSEKGPCAASFSESRKAFRAATLLSSVEWPQAPPAPLAPVQQPQQLVTPPATGAALELPGPGHKGAEYLSGNYTSLEFDCLFKVPVPVGSLRDWSAGAGGPDGGSSAEVPRLFSISSAAASAVPVPLLPLLPLGDPPIAEVPPAALPAQAQPNHRPSFSELRYAPGANLYVAGEVYAPLAASIGFRRSAAKKLLQTERLLQFLRAKEGADDVCNCVLVFVLMGPHMDAEMGATLFLTLEHYQRVLPCTWALQRAGRLLGLRVAAVSAAVSAAQSSWAIADLRAEVTGLRAEMHDGFDRLAGLFTASLTQGAV